MKKTKNENQFSGDDRKPHRDITRYNIKGKELFRNGAEQNGFEDRGLNENGRYVAGSRTERGLSNDSKAQRDTNRNKSDSVAAEMHIRSRKNDTEGRTGYKNRGKKNEEESDN